MKTATLKQPAKVQLGNLNKTTPASKKAGVVIRGLEKLVEVFTEAKSAFQVAEGRLETAKAELVDASLPKFYQEAKGESSATLQGLGKNATLVVPNRYKVLDDDMARNAQDAIGAKVFGQYWEQTIKLSIKFDLVEPSKRQSLVDGLLALAEKLDIPTSGVESPIAVTDGVAPNAQFHDERFKLPLKTILAVHQHGGLGGYVR